jgi:hypothetical protein
MQRNSISANAVGTYAGRSVLGCLAMIGALWGLAATAGTLTTVDIPATGSDAGSGLSSNKTYTHALDFGATTGTQVINGVTFTRVSAASGTGYTLSGTFSPYAGAAHPYADGGMSNLLTDFSVCTDSTNVLTLSGLTPGKTYSVRVYYRPWSAPRSVTVTFNGDGGDSALLLDEDAGSAAHFLKYNFTASGSSVAIAMVRAGAAGWHLFGVSCEERPPLATLSIVDIPATGSDVASGLSGAKTYTHALDFGTTTGTLNINGVTFTRVNAAAGTGYAFSPSVITPHAGNANTYTDGSMSTLLTEFVYYGVVAPSTLVLSGLAPNVKYSTRVYYRTWTPSGTANVLVTFNGDDNDIQLLVNEDAGNAAHYLKYDFTATGTNVVVKTTPSPVNAWQLYGVSTEQIPPVGTVVSVH